MASSRLIGGLPRPEPMYYLSLLLHYLPPGSSINDARPRSPTTISQITMLPPDRYVPLGPDKRFRAIDFTLDDPSEAYIRALAVANPKDTDPDDTLVAVTVINSWGLDWDGDHQYNITGTAADADIVLREIEVADWDAYLDGVIARTKLRIEEATARVQAQENDDVQEGNEDHSDDHENNHAMAVNEGNIKDEDE